MLHVQDLEHPPQALDLRNLYSPLCISSPHATGSLKYFFHMYLCLSCMLHLSPYACLCVCVPAHVQLCAMPRWPICWSWHQPLQRMPCRYCTTQQQLLGQGILQGMWRWPEGCQQESVQVWLPLHWQSWSSLWLHSSGWVSLDYLSMFCYVRSFERWGLRALSMCHKCFASSVVFINVWPCLSQRGAYGRANCGD